MLTTFVREDTAVSDVRPGNFGAMAAEAAILAVLAAMAVYYYGARAAIVTAVCVGVCLAADTLCLILRRKHLHIHDLSSVITGLTLAVMLPASVSYKAAAAAGLFAVCIAKHPFGGRGHEIVNCAAAGYIFAELSFPRSVLLYPKPFAELPLGNIVSGGLLPSFTRTAAASGTGNYSDLELLIGNFTGPMGCTCTVLVTVCALVLIQQKAISAGAFLGEMAVVLGASFLKSGAAGLKLTLTGGMLVFAAAFLTADTNIAPQKPWARLFYGILAGLLTAAVSQISALENPAVYACIIAAPLGRSIDGLPMMQQRRQRVKNIFGAANTASTASEAVETVETGEANADTVQGETINGNEQ